VERNQLLERGYAVIEATNAGAALPAVARVDEPLPQPYLDKLAETDLTPKDRAALREQGWPAAPDDRAWNMPVGRYRRVYGGE